jgi:hypothetical protein
MWRVDVMKGLPLLMTIQLSCQATSLAIFFNPLDRLFDIKPEGSSIHLSK